MDRRKNKVPCFCPLCNRSLVFPYYQRKHAQAYEASQSYSLVEDPGLSSSTKFECAYARDIRGQPLQAGIMYTRHTQTSFMIEDPILTTGTGSYEPSSPLPECVQTDGYELPMSWSLNPESL